jgi:uncharacterized protein
MRSRHTLIIAAVVLLIAILIGGRWATLFLVDYWWFSSLEFADVFWRLWTAGVGVRIAAAVVAAVVVFVNLKIVARSLGAVRIRRRFGDLEIEEQLPRAYVTGVAAVIAVLSGWWLSVGMGDPVVTLAFLFSESWGQMDPVFGRDISFYVHAYPFLRRLQTLLGVLLFWTFLLSLIAYLATGAVRWTEAGPRVTPPARRHLGVLGGLLFGVLAWSFWLDRYELLMTGQGIGGALGYTDVAARLPAIQVVALLALIAGATVAWGAWQRSLAAPAFGIGLLIVGGVVGQLVVPSLVQRFQVEPNELAREGPYIEHNLAFTRLAYGLDGLDRQPLPYDPGARPDPEAFEAALARVPLWDLRPILDVFDQQESLFRHYDFVSVHLDRYGEPGAAEPVAISVRELDVRRLEGAQTWQNFHLNWVRSEGVVAAAASRMAPDGAPAYYIRGIAPFRIHPEAPEGLQLSSPGVYFGELTRDYVILTPGRQERVDAHSEAAEGVIGVPLGSAWRRLVYAWAFQSPNILLSGEINPQSRIVYQRQVRERVSQVAPFLTLPSPDDPDAGPYPVIHEGRVVWIVDGYTTSRHFPLAAMATFADRRTRYVRNSVKAVVDGLTGEVTLYSVDDQDALLRTYSRIFPGLIRPFGEMPESLQRHLRVPAELFDLQARVLTEYHLRDARAFYHREDLWERPTELYRGRRQAYRPFYTMLALPGTDQVEFLSMMPFVARGRQNMTGLLVARNDPPHYGERTLYELPRDELIRGPQQIEAMIDQNPVISEQLTLWARAGSDVIRGHMAVVPIGGTFAYIEPLFLEAQEHAIPQLERVIVAIGRRVVMRPTVAEAVRALLAEPDEDVDEPVTEVAVPGMPAPGPALDRARNLLDEADEALRRGDWAAFGDAWSRLQRVLREEGR